MMQLSWSLLLTWCYIVLHFRVKLAAATNGIAHSHVRSIGIVSHTNKGKPVHIDLKRNGQTSSKERQDASKAKATCIRRIQMIVGEASLDNFQRELLLCQYQELHAALKKQQQDYERAWRRSSLSEVVNPYVREFTDEIVNPHNFTFLLQPKPCSSADTMLISVHSAAQNTQKRQVIRNTWGNHRILREFFPKGHKSKLIFILGQPSNNTNQSLIEYESEEFGDILQADFHDHYHNNTYKAIYHMKWASGPDGCPKVSLILKSDDDIMLNVRKIPGFWKNFTKQVAKMDGNLMIAGNIFMDTGPIREPASKWFIPYKVFKYDTFPPWFQGMVYFLTPQLADKIYQLSFTTPYIFTDDVYVGIVADRVHGIQRLDLGNYYDHAYDPMNKKLLRWRFDNLVFYHNRELAEMMTLWFYYCSFRSCR